MRVRKGISAEVIIFAILAVVIAGIAIFYFSGRLGPGATQLSKEECKQKMQTVCSSFTSTGNPAVFKEIPQTCADILDVSSLFKACQLEKGNQCKLLCEAIEIGTVTPEGEEAAEISPEPEGGVEPGE
jgi:hypothetical protein